MSRPDVRPALAEAYADGRLTIDDLERGLEYELEHGALSYTLRPRPPRTSFVQRTYHSRWLPYTIGAVSLNATVIGCVLAAGPSALAGFTLMIVGFVLFAVLCFCGPREE